MRVKTLTLTTASAAALTIGLASPALALAPAVGDLGAAHNQTLLGAHHQGALHSGVHHQVMLPRDDDDDEGDGGGDDGGEAESGHRSHHNRGLCGVGGSIGGLAQGCGEEGGEGDDDEGGGGDHGSEETSNCCAGGGGHHEKHIRVTHSAPQRVVVHREVQAVPRGGVPTGFGGSQGSSAPLGLAGLSLMLGGAGLLPLARRRMRASGRA